MYRGKEVNLCVPTLNRYDLLEKLIQSALNGTVPPDNVYIVDNGGRLETTNDFIHIKKFGINVGVAKGWNWLITNSKENRIISNDDIEFYPDTIASLLDCDDDFVYTQGIEQVNMFSLFKINDNLINKIGLFDEDISPNYAYFEDNDYAYRMKLAGIGATSVDCRAKHLGSMTLKAYNKNAMEDHHRRFSYARANYIHKWGGEPGKETFTTPYGR